MTDLPLTPEDVAEIVAILEGSTYQTLDVKTARFRLRVARDGDDDLDRRQHLPDPRGGGSAGIGP